jgi:hypothetical protein
MPSTASAPVRSRSRSSGRSRVSRQQARRPAGLGQRVLRWVEKRLGHSIQLRGQGLQMRLVVKKIAKVPEVPLFPGMVVLKAISQEKQELMQKDLRQLLRQHPQTKTLLRHLAYVERTLRHDGLKAVDDLPLDVMSKALTQLETLVVNWSAMGLGEVRSRLSLLVKNKKILALQLGGTAHATEMDHSQRADVCEVSHSVFDEMERSWRGTAPPTLTHTLVPASAATAG